MPGKSAALLCGLRKALENLLMRLAVDPQMAVCPMGTDSDILEAVYALSDPRAGKFFQETMLVMLGFSINAIYLIISLLFYYYFVILTYSKSIQDAR